MRLMPCRRRSASTFYDYSVQFLSNAAEVKKTGLDNGAVTRSPRSDLKHILNGDFVTMHRINFLGRGLALWACMGMLAAPVASAQTPHRKESAPRVHDVELGRDGVLRGHLLDAKGHQVAHAAVTAVRDGQAVAQAVAKENGAFEMKDLTGGLYVVGTAEGQQVVRVWQHGTAPPTAKKQILCVQGETVRGQLGSGGGLFGNGCSLLFNPWIIGIAVGTAIAVPLALDDNESS